MHRIDHCKPPIQGSSHSVVCVCGMLSEGVIVGPYILGVAIAEY